MSSLFVYFVDFVLRYQPMSVDYLAIARRTQLPDDYERNEITPITGESGVSGAESRHEINEVNEKSRLDLLPQLWPIPDEPDIVEEMRAWLADGTLKRIGRGRSFQYSNAMWCIDLPEFARRLIARIDAQEEGPYTWQRLELAYWTVRCWMEEATS